MARYVRRLGAWRRSVQRRAHPGDLTVSGGESSGRKALAVAAAIASFAATYLAPVAVGDQMVARADHPSARASAILTVGESAKMTQLLRRCPEEVLLGLEPGLRRHIRGSDIRADIVRNGPYYDYRWQLRRRATFCGLIVFYVGAIPTAFPEPTHRSKTGGDYVDETRLSAGSVRVIIVIKPFHGH